ncbi:MAG: TMEM175 family protein [Marmoricola sp.]
MPTGRLEAFSDGVLAVVITVMVLELKVPHGASWPALRESGLGFLTYLLSFVFVGIYWNNHHHMFQLCHRIDGSVLWANLHLLFWISLFPFTTSWLDDSRVGLVPTIVYGVDLLLAAVAYYLLEQALFRIPETGHHLRTALGRDLKGKLSPVFYVVGIGLAFVYPWLGLVPFVLVALMWLVPDRRVERYLEASPGLQH